MVFWKKGEKVKKKVEQFLKIIQFSEFNPF